MMVTIRITDDVSGVKYAIAKLSAYNNNYGIPVSCNLSR